MNMAAKAKTYWVLTVGSLEVVAKTKEKFEIYKKGN